MADEYIKREDAIAKPFRFYWQSGALSNPVVSVKSLKALPSADVAPVQHGKWNVYSAKDCLYTCSVCSHLPVQKTPYCPNCGAKMDGGEDDAVD